MVDLALAYSVGSGVEPDMTCQFEQDKRTSSWRDFVIAFPDALAASRSCRVLTDRWFSPHFSVLSDFRCGGGRRCFLAQGPPACLACLLLGYSG